MPVSDALSVYHFGLLPTKHVLREMTPEHWAASIRIGPEEPDIEAVVEKKIQVQYQPGRRHRMTKRLSHVGT